MRSPKSICKPNRRSNFSTIKSRRKKRNQRRTSGRRIQVLPLVWISSPLAPPLINKIVHIIGLTACSQAKEAVQWPIWEIETLLRIRSWFHQKSPFITHQSRTWSHLLPDSPSANIEVQLVILVQRIILNRRRAKLLLEIHREITILVTRRRWR